MDAVKEEIAQVSARLIAEEGLTYGAAKQRALHQLGLSARSALPTNEQVEVALEEYLALFCADTQPGELRALRSLALEWMERLVDFNPQLSGAVWRGTATRRSDIHVQLYCDDPKAAELALIDQAVRYDVQVGRDAQGRAYDVLSIQSLCRPLGEYVGVHLSVRDYRARHGSLLADSRGRTAQGGVAALQKLLEKHGEQ
jgi:hypothetical protein